MPDVRLCAMDKNVNKSWCLLAGRKQEYQWFKVQCHKCMQKAVLGVWRRWVQFLLIVVN